MGVDKFGTWKAEGDIFARNGELAMFLVKNYDNKAAAGQTGQFQHLIYESTSYSDREGFQGRWYYEGFEGSSQYSGIWKLWDIGSTGAQPGRNSGVYGGPGVAPNPAAYNPGTNPYNPGTNPYNTGSAPYNSTPPQPYFQ